MTHFWTPEEEAYLRRMITEIPLDKIAAHLSLTVMQVRNKKQRMGLKSGVNWSHKQYYTPWNKGKKRNWRGGRDFPKGQKPHNAKEIGEVWIAKNHQGRDCYWIKLEGQKPKKYAAYLWEQINGEIPPRHIVVHKDGDQLNISIENLICISQAENLKRNSNPSMSSYSAWKTKKGLGTVDYFLQGGLAR